MHPWGWAVGLLESEPRLHQIPLLWVKNAPKAVGKGPSSPPDNFWFGESAQAFYKNDARGQVHGVLPWVATAGVLYPSAPFVPSILGDTGALRGLDLLLDSKES